MYHYIHYNESRVVDADDDVFEGDDDVEFVLYLHFSEEQKWSDSNETRPLWMISKNEISMNALAVCEREDLMDCTNDSWIVEKQYHQDRDG